MPASDNLERKLTTNSLLFFAGTLGSRILIFLFYIIVPRFMGRDEYGVFTYSVILTGYIAVVLGLSSEQIIVRELSRRRHNPGLFIGNAILLKGFLTIFAVFAGVVINFIFYSNTEFFIYNFILLFVLIFSVKVQSFKSVFDAVCKSSYKAVFSSVNELIFHVLLLLLALTGIYLVKSNLFIVWGYALCGLPGLIFLGNASIKIIRPHFKFDRDIIKYLLKESFPLCALALFYTLTARIDIFMLEYFHGTGEIGIYSVAFRLCEPLLFVPVSLVVSLLPLISKIYRENKENAAKIYCLGFKSLMMVSVPVAVVISESSGFIIKIPYGPEFYPAADVLSIYVYTIIFGFITVLAVDMLIATGRQAKVLYVFMGAAAVNFTLNFFLIPLHSYTGATAATVITDGLVCLTFIWLTREFFKGFKLINIVRMLIVYCTGILIYIFIRDLSSIAGAAVVCLCPVILFFTGFFNKEELGRIRNIFKFSE